MTDYPSLFAGYASAMIGWWALLAVLRRLDVAPAAWRSSELPTFRRPWLELAMALAAVAGVLAMGTLWSGGRLLPRDASLGPLLETANQFAIFAPMLLLPLLRRQGTVTMLLPREGVLLRLGAGVVLAGGAFAVCALVRGFSFPGAALRLFRYEHLDEAAQVLFEDLAIGVLLVRLTSMIGVRAAIGAAALLFAAGHVPELLRGGAQPGDLLPLLADAGLGVLVLGTVLRSRDVLWFWPIHFALDMTQFEGVTVG